MFCHVNKLSNNAVLVYSLLITGSKTVNSNGWNDNIRTDNNNTTLFFFSFSIFKMFIKEKIRRKWILLVMIPAIVACIVMLNVKFIIFPHILAEMFRLRFVTIHFWILFRWIFFLCSQTLIFNCFSIIDSDWGRTVTARCHRQRSGGPIFLQI